MKIIITSPLAKPLAEVVAVREIHGEDVEIQCVKITFSSARAIIYFILSHPEDLVHVTVTNEQFNQIMMADIQFWRFIHDEKGDLKRVVRVFHEEMPLRLFGKEMEHPIYCLKEVWRIPESLTDD